jgi:hypothetical protein
LIDGRIGCALLEGGLRGEMQSVMLDDVEPIEAFRRPEDTRRGRIRAKEKIHVRR